MNYYEQIKNKLIDDVGKKYNERTLRRISQFDVRSLRERIKSKEYVHHGKENKNE